MAEEHLTFRRSAFGPLAVLADETQYVVTHDALNPLDSWLFLVRLAVAFATRHRCQSCAAVGFASLCLRLYRQHIQMAE